MRMQLTLGVDTCRLQASASVAFAKGVEGRCRALLRPNPTVLERNATFEMYEIPNLDPDKIVESFEINVITNKEYAIASSVGPASGADSHTRVPCEQAPRRKMSLRNNQDPGGSACCKVRHSACRLFSRHACCHRAARPRQWRCVQRACMAGGLRNWRIE